MLSERDVVNFKTHGFNKLPKSRSVGEVNIGESGDNWRLDRA